MRATTPLVERFWPKVDVRGDDECWPWLAGKDNHGYGKISLGPRRENGGRDLKAHRVAYELLVGPIPEGREPDHTCRNPGCVNPAHLDIVTHRENMLRGNGVSGVNARKEKCKRGHPFDEENTRIRVRGGNPSRICRICQRDNQRIRRTKVYPGGLL